MLRQLAARIRNEEGGAALAMTMFLIIAVAALSVAVAGVTLAQVQPTQSVRKNVRTLHAAEAGLDAGLARVRSAKQADQDNEGDLGALPCSSAHHATMTGSVGPEQGDLRYHVRIRYYDQDPTGRDESWRDANKVHCNPSGQPQHTPKYALLQSQGLGQDVPGSPEGQGDRSLETIYDFSLSNENVAGGPIGLYLTDLCLDGRHNPSAGDEVGVETCDPADEGQRWAYRRDLTIVLLHTLAEDGTGGLCVSAQNRVHETNAADRVVLEPCWSSTKTGGKWQGTNSTDETRRLRQQWSFNDNGRFEQPHTNGDTNGWCIRRNGSLLQTRNSCSGGYNDTYTWIPDPKVGAGQAGTIDGQLGTNGQLVNYREFGRCFDVTNQDINKNFMIAYPCKQAPDETKVRWNQRLTRHPNETSWDGTLRTTNSTGTTRCLTAGTGPGIPASGTRVLMRPCDVSAAQKWHFTGANGSYAENFNIRVRDTDLCLAVDAPDTSDIYLGNWSTIVVETCDGTTDQKWNAPPNLEPSQLRNTVETTAAG